MDAAAMTPIRRVVTGHDPSGKAIVLFDSRDPHRVVRPESGTASSLQWITEQAPAAMDGSADRAAVKVGIAPPEAGTIFRVVDFPPTSDEEIARLDPELMHRAVGPATSRARPPSHPFMHRTASVDYAIVMSGEIDMQLDQETVHLAAGDVVVQQGTNHAWINRGPVPCRIAFVLVGARDPLGGCSE